MSMDIVVVNFKTPVDLKGFLDSYEFFPPSQPHTVHIMNVEPGEVSLAVGESYRRRNGGLVEVTNFDTNVGYGHAVNVGVSQGSHDTIAIFNADVVLTPTALDACASMLWRYHGTGILGPRQHDERGRITHAGIFGTQDKPEHRGWQSTGDKFRDTRPAVSVSGSAYFIKRHVWDFLTECPNYQEFYPGVEGAFLETQHYFEETWCSYHAAEHGFGILYYGAIDLIHKWHKASPVGGDIDRIVMPQSRQKFREACDHHGIVHD